MGLIRLLFALAVIVSHSTDVFGLSFIGGSLAIPAFFILSGFYISLILNEKYIKKNNSYFLFLSNRLLRLYPTYWLILLFILLFSAFQYSTAKILYANGEEYGLLSIYYAFRNSISIPAYIVFIFTNIFILGQDALFYMGLHINSGQLYFTKDITAIYPQLYNFMLINQAWTLAIELLFYAVAPFIVRKSWKVLCLYILGSVILRGVLVKNGLNFDPWAYRFFPTELVYFLMGALSYNLYARVKEMQFNRKKLYLLYGVFILITLYYNPPINFLLRFPYLLLLSLVTPLIFILTKSWSIDRYLGDLSYILYISHVFVKSLIGYFKIPYWTSQGVTLTVCAIIFSVAVQELFSKRIEFIRQKRLR